jgi:hypothetical protein
MIVGNYNHWRVSIIQKNERLINAKISYEIEKDAAWKLLRRE